MAAGSGVVKCGWFWPFGRGNTTEHYLTTFCWPCILVIIGFDKHQSLKKTMGLEEHFALVCHFGFCLFRWYIALCYPLFHQHLGFVPGELKLDQGQLDYCDTSWDQKLYLHLGWLWLSLI